MERTERISKINRVLQDYFEKHSESEKNPAKEFMFLFIENGIFNQNNRNNLPIRRFLRGLDKENLLNEIPYIYAERKKANVYWFFSRVNIDNKEKLHKKGKVFLSFLLALLFVGAITSCSLNADTEFPEITHVAFQTNKNGKWGLIGTDGKVLFEEKISPDKEVSYAVNGVFRTYDWDDNKYLYYSATENPELIGSPKGYKYGGLSSEGIIPVVTTNERIHYITNSGETAFYLLPYKEKEFLCVCPFFTEQRAWFQLDNYKYGYIDSQGNVVIEPIYDQASPFHEGKAIVYRKEDDTWLAIDINGKELFKVSSNGHQQYSDALYHNGYCLIENFLLNEKGEKVQRFPLNISYISPFINNVALYQDSKTELWGQINIQGEKIGEHKYPRALGIIDDWIYVGDTIPNLRNETNDKYMNVYAINSKGETLNKIENVSYFYPLSKSVIIAENNKYYFADKKGHPINNKSYHKISIPQSTKTPSHSSLWSFLSSPLSIADYGVWGLPTSYIDCSRTVKSILEKLTDRGIGKIIMGQSALNIASLYPPKDKRLSDWMDLDYKEYGINYIYVTYSVGLINDAVIVIKVNINTDLLPTDDSDEKIAKEIPAYLTGTLGLKKIKHGNSYRYHSEKNTYDIIYNDGETEFILVVQALIKN